MKVMLNVDWEPGEDYMAFSSKVQCTLMLKLSDK